MRKDKECGQFRLIELWGIATHPETQDTNELFLGEFLTVDEAEEYCQMVYDLFPSSFETLLLRKMRKH